MVRVKEKMKQRAQLGAWYTITTMVVLFQRNPVYPLLYLLGKMLSVQVEMGHAMKKVLSYSAEKAKYSSSNKEVTLSRDDGESLREKKYDR